MAKIGVTLVGYGQWGKNYLNNLRDMEEVKVSMVCDLKNKPSDHLMPYGSTFTFNFEDVLNDENSDALIIATPANTHYSLVLQALEKGKHVSDEKPITTNSKQAKELIQIAREKGLVLMVGHTFKYNPALIHIKQMITNGDLGEMKYIESKRVGLGPIRQDVSALWDLATHDIYMTTFILGSLPETVSYQGVSHNGKIDDISNLNMKFSGDVLATIYANWEHPIKERKFILGGTKKAILFDDVQPAEKIVVYDRGVNYQVEGGFGEFQATTRGGDLYIPNIPVKQPLLEELKHFIDCIVGKAKCNSDGDDGLNTVRILEAAEKSRKLNGQEVRLDE